MSNNSFIINADDFGISKGVSEGILDLLSSGKINSTSAMVCCKNSCIYSKLIYKKGFNIGIHITLSGKFKALTGVSSITDKKGYFYSPDKLFSLCLKGFIKKADIYLEIDAQLTCFMNYYGHIPMHLDGHHYIHQIPLISNVIFKVFKDKKINKNVTIRDCSTNILKAIKTSPKSFVKIIFLHIMGTLLMLKCKYHNVKTDGNFYGIYPFESSSIYKCFLYNFKKNCSNENDFIVVHPALFSDQEIINCDSLTGERVDEYKSFL